MDPVKRGGKRKNAGRKSAGVSRHQVTLDPATVEKATKLGGGNLSAGIRIAVKAV